MASPIQERDLLQMYNKARNNVTEWISIIGGWKQNADISSYVVKSLGET